MSAWDCPYCGRVATIGKENITDNSVYFNNENKDGLLCLITKTITCPNKECREYTITTALYKNKPKPTGGMEIVWPPIMEWRLRPQSEARPFPAYIPAPILEDYTEACLIRDLSPKASATLSRRCLQGMIRDFWGITKNRLIDEINELKNSVDPATWAAIDAVRNIGNIGAHMEKDINLVIEVDAEEAQLLIGLIEILLRDWYILRHQRNEHLADIVALAQAKKAKPIAMQSP